MMIAALSSATQQAKPPKFSRNWGTECLNTRLPRPTLLLAGYSVKLKKTKEILKSTKVATRTRDLQYNFS